MLNNLARPGKEDKPIVVSRTGGIEFDYDLDDVDGMFVMLNRALTGCVVIGFSKPMNEAIRGTVTVDGKAVERFVWMSLPFMGGIQLFAIQVRGIVTEYDRTYTAQVEGFVDTDGNTMDSQEIVIKTLPKRQPVSGYEEHDQVALEAAREGIVLLKNEGDLLPLPPGSVLNVFGKGLFEFRTCAFGAGKINPRYTIGFANAIENGSAFTLNPDLKAIYQAGRDVVPGDDVLEAAYQQSNVAVIVITRMSGENYDNAAAKGEFYLSDEEEAMIRTVTAKFSKTVAVLNAGYPMDVTWVEKYQVKAVIACGFPGMLGGQALVEILDGRVNPSGKLPDTWSLDYYDIPASQNFYNAVNGRPALPTDAPVFVDTVYEEDIYVGYRYFETFGKSVAYPFGHGLSYTRFEITATSFASTSAETRLSVAVRNTGYHPGKEVVQVYAEEPDGKLEKPSRKLVAFAKTKLLEPGEVQTLAFSFPAERFTAYDEDSAAWIMEPGQYALWVGNSIQSLSQAGSFVLDQTRVLKQVTNRVRPPMAIQRLSKQDPQGSYPTGKCSGIKPGVSQLEPKAERAKTVETHPIDAGIPKQPILFKEVCANLELLGSFVKQMSIEELARLSVCAGAGWGRTELGEAGRLSVLEKYAMQPFIVADGNSGVNIYRPNIGIPCSTVVCSSFNPDLAYAVGRVIAEEAKENGVNLILAPGMNIHRNPLNGRHPEYFSEDPYLAGVMAGHQSKGLEENGVGSCLKHVAANNCETSRKRNHSLISERALREIYLKAFEVAIQVHQPDSIMTAYNALNGVFTAEDEELILGIFREEFGFDGYVMTDWNSYDSADIVAAIQAGNSWMTPGSEDDQYVKPIIEGVISGRIDRDRLEKNVFYLLKTIIKRSCNRPTQQ
jgi:beta-glucosidase